MDSPIVVRLFEKVALDPGLPRPVYLQLTDAILQWLRSGKLVAGQKLPSSRDAAQLLGINRITVSKAYWELEVQGWLESGVGRGTFVSGHIADHKPIKLKKGVITGARQVAGFRIHTLDYLSLPAGLSVPDLHLDDGYPDPRLAPLKELYRAYRNQLTRSGLYKKFGSYGNPAGSDYYRKSMANYLSSTRGLNCGPANILSVRGTLMGIHLICSALISPGDIVVAGIPGWTRVEHNIRLAGGQHIGLPVDEHGLVIDQLRKLCKKKKVHMVYVTPHHHYPTTVSLRRDRRLELLRLAEEYGFIILEDDYDFDFHYEHRPLLPLASEDENGMVIYCGSFSKSFSPAFRIGYIVAPVNVIDYLSKVRTLHDRQGDHILDNAMADIINDGTVQRYLRRTLPVYEHRRNLFCGLLREELTESVDFMVPDGGMSVWTRFDKKIDLQKLSDDAYKKGLLLCDGEIKMWPGISENALRLGFASSSDDELRKSIQIIAAILQRKRTSGSSQS